MVGLRAQSKSQARLHLISCLSFPCLQSIFAYYGSPNQSIVPSYSRYLVSLWWWLLLGQAGGWGATRCPGKSKRGLFSLSQRAVQVLCQIVLFLCHMARHRGELEQEKRRHCGSIGPGQPVARKIGRGDGEQRENSRHCPRTDGLTE